MANPAHCAVALSVLKALDEELAANGKRRGLDLSWSVADQRKREMLADQFDACERAKKLRQLASADADAKLFVKLNAEVRQCNTQITRLLNEIKTDVPAPQSLTSIKATRAINTRWERERARNASNQ
jgi:hypothetical protein